MLRNLKRWNFDIRKYWDDRYKEGGNSGAGSYGELALFKAEIINDFIKKNKVKHLIDFGCGDGNVLSLFKYYNKYTGVDVSPYIIEKCRKKYEQDETKDFVLYQKGLHQELRAELSISLDVIFHLVKQKTYIEYLLELFNLSTEYVIIYSSNQIGEDNNHVKERVFLTDVEKYCTGWKLDKVVFNRFPYDLKFPDSTSRSNFYFFSKAL